MGTRATTDSAVSQARQVMRCTIREVLGAANFRILRAQAAKERGAVVRPAAPTRQRGRMAGSADAAGSHVGHRQRDACHAGGVEAPHGCAVLAAAGCGGSADGCRGYAPGGLGNLRGLGLLPLQPHLRLRGCAGPKRWFKSPRGSGQRVHRVTAGPALCATFSTNHHIIKTLRSLRSPARSALDGRRFPGASRQVSPQRDKSPPDCCPTLVAALWGALCTTPRPPSLMPPLSWAACRCTPSRREPR